MTDIFDHEDAVLQSFNLLGDMDKLIVAMRTMCGNSLLFCRRAHLLDEHSCCVVDELRVNKKPGKSMTAMMRAVS